MNDIEILELYANTDNKYDGSIEIEIKYAIKNLIQRNKELEQIEKEHKEENGRLRDRIKELEDVDLTTVYMNGIYDERDKWNIKIKKIVDLYNNTLQCTRKYNEELADILCDLEELLGDEN